MTGPGVAALLGAVDATWPAVAVHAVPGWRVREGGGGGKRVSAATATGPEAEIAAMEAAQAALGQPPLVMVRPGEDALDARLAAAGYRVVDPVRILVAETAAMAAPPERLTAFVVDWPPLEVLREIWAEGGIGPGRVAVMDRVQGPKCALMGRAEDRPAAAAFVACDGPVAMLHALEVRPPLRRQGTARHLMRAAALWARGAGATWLALLVTEANRPAGALYASLGMQAVGSYHYRAGPEEPRAGGGQP